MSRRGVHVFLFHASRTALGAGLALTACAAPPTVPAPPGPPRWSTSPRADERAALATEGASARSSELPDLAVPAGGALSLERLVNRALESNRGLLDARDGVQSADYSVRAAEAEFELRIFPSASARGGGGDRGVSDVYGVGVELRRRFATGTSVSVAPGIDVVNGTFTSEVATTITQPLLRGRQRELVLSAVDAAEFSAKSARRSLYLTQVDTALATLTAAYQVVRQRQFLRLNEDSAQRLEGHERAARARERAGLASSLDVFRAGLQHNQARDNLDASREGYGEALDSLRILLALPLSAPVEVDAPLHFDFVHLDEEEAVALALASRVELDQARHTLDEAERRSRVARHETEPDLDLALSYSQFGTAQDLDDSLSMNRNAVSVSLVTSSDLFRTAERARFGQSLLDVRAARRNLELLTDQIVRQVRRELRDLDRAEKRIAIQEDQIRQAEGKLALARVKFNRGLASNFDVIEAEQELRAGQTTLVSAVIDLIIGTHRLRATTGTLLERPPGL